jgi:hypothetical protein
LSKSKSDDLKLENVCKENIKYRNKLGIELKVVLNSDECHKAIKKYDTIKSGDKSDTSLEMIDSIHIINGSEEDLQLNNCFPCIASQTSLQSTNQLTVNNSHNINDIDLRVNQLLEKYNFETENTTQIANDRKRRREPTISPPRKHQFCDNTEPIERKHSERCEH